MRKHVRAAFVVTVSVAATAGCHKQPANGSCEPPDCHANPPPQNPPEPATITPPTPTINANPPATPPTIHANPPPMRIDAGQQK
jgi:hypothetical protein